MKKPRQTTSVNMPRTTATRTNIASHFVGIPLIVVAVAVLLSRPEWAIGARVVDFTSGDRRYCCRRGFTYAWNWRWVC